MPLLTHGQRPCPLLDRPTASTRLPYAPEPWDLRQCSETGFVYLDNPVAPTFFEQEHAWEVSWAKANAKRAQAEPLRYRFSSLNKRARSAMRRNKVRDLAIGLLESRPHDRRALLDVGCGGGELLTQIAQHLAQ
ncbi:MAG: hypothetical protein ACK4F7_02755, partial [Inhella sp.]